MAGIRNTPATVAFLLARFATAAQAADVDFGPLVSAGLEYVLVPVLGAAATWRVGMSGLAAKSTWTGRPPTSSPATSMPCRRRRSATAQHQAET